MKRSLSLVCALALGLVASTAAHAAVELLSNPSLDLTVPYANNPSVPTDRAPQPASWSVTGNKTISGSYNDPLSSEPWSGPAPTPVTTNGTGLPYNTGTGCGGTDCGVFFKPFGGNATTGDYATGRLSQLLLAVPGQEYKFSGWAGAEANYSGLIPGTITDTELAIDFLGPGQVLLSSSIVDLQANGLGAPNGQAFNYAKFSVTGTAPANALFVRPRISMINAYSNPAGGGQALVVDDFSLIAVPEPSSIMLIGMSLLGTLAMRRRS